MCNSGELNPKLVSVKLLWGRQCNQQEKNVLTLGVFTDEQ